MFDFLISFSSSYLYTYKRLIFLNTTQNEITNIAARCESRTIQNHHYFSYESFSLQQQTMGLLVSVFEREARVKYIRNIRVSMFENFKPLSFDVKCVLTLNDRIRE